jgi:hypothetical protein
VRGDNRNGARGASIAPGASTTYHRKGTRCGLSTKSLVEECGTEALVGPAALQQPNHVRSLKLWIPRHGPPELRPKPR